jgi:hypothetical protein
MFEIIDGYANSFKVKYVYLDKMFNGHLTDTTKNGKRIVNTANIYINFESLYNCIRNTHVEKYLRVANKKEVNEIYRNMISNFINIVAHYRNYFSKSKIKTNIFLYYNNIPQSRVEYNNTALVKGYREHFFKSLTDLDRITVNTIIRESIDFMKIITEYIENVYMVGTDSVESSLVPMIIHMENKHPANVNIIVSKDAYDLQYTNYNFLVISKFKNEPVLLTKRNVMKYMCFKNKFEPKRDINPLLLPFIVSCDGDRKRSIKGVSGYRFTKIYKSLESLYEAGYIYDEDEDTFKISNLAHVIHQSNFNFLNKEDIANQVVRNYRAVDFEYQYDVTSDVQKQKIFDQLSDKTDPDTLMDINDKYFADCPLMLMELNQYSKRNELLEEVQL